MEHYDKAYVETPMGTAEIIGDNFGIVSISVIDDKITSDCLPYLSEKINPTE